MDAPELIDELIDDRVVVFGSLPPAGRDIDIVAWPSQLELLERGLRAAGFTTIGGSLVRFRDCRVDAVELVAVSGWGLPEEAARDLFDAAIPLPGRARLCRPSPAHAMLIAARRLPRERGTGAGKATRHFAAALEEQPEAIDLARERSRAWRVSAAMRALEGGDGRLDLGSRLRGLYGEGRGRGSGALRSLAWAARQQVPRAPRRGGLIALSGLDGSGKSTQAAALVETLSRLGFDARVEWVPMHKGPWLSRIDAALRPLVQPLVSLRGRMRGSTPPGPQATGSARPGDVAGAEREPFLYRSPSLTMIWSTAMALRLALRTGFVLRSEIRRGRVIVCDRYVLDAWTYLRYNYHAAPSLRIQFGLVRLLSPRPLRSFALIVDAETATGRKPEYDVAQNTRRAAYYDECMGRLGVERIDGNLPPAAICTRIAADVCGALG